MMLMRIEGFDSFVDLSFVALAPLVQKCLPGGRTVTLFDPYQERRPGARPVQPDAVLRPGHVQGGPGQGRRRDGGPAGVPTLAAHGGHPDLGDGTLRDGRLVQLPVPGGVPVPGQALPVRVLPQ
ncbi:unnamed protein product, partial [Ixodes pacificus]